MIIPVEAERDAQGYWSHPALTRSGCETSAEFVYWLRMRAAGCRSRRMMTAGFWVLSTILTMVRCVTGFVTAQRPDASAWRRCPAPVAGEKRVSPGSGAFGLTPVNRESL